jgi:hypothetical protein
MKATGNVMSNEIFSGIVIIGGVAMLVIGAESSLPLVAGIGAAATLGAGAAQAFYVPRRKANSAQNGDAAPPPNQLN